MPVYNEADNLYPLYNEIVNVFKGIDKSYEIIFVDDGSQDHSFDTLEELYKNDPSVRVIQFRRNFGQTAAFVAGFDHAEGEFIATLDADGQNNPGDLPQMLNILQKEDVDFIIGIRVGRKESFVRRLLSGTANHLISRFTGITIHDRGCSLKVFKADLVKNMRLYGQLHRFMPELASAVGARIAEFPTKDRPRRAGKSKYGAITRTPRVFLDLLTVFFLLTFFTSPMRLYGSLGLLSGLTGVAIGGILALIKIYQGFVGGWAAFHAYQIGSRPLFLLGILLIILGVQFMMMGFLGEMIMRTYYEARNKPVYTIRRIL